MPRRVLLLILDGWGLAPASDSNAISVAGAPNFQHLWSQNPHFRLDASGEAVGLPKGQMGNSEVGHLNLGAGRVVLQDLPRITNAIEDGSFFKNEILLSSFAKAKQTGRAVHLIGLVSPGGVHSHQKHLYALLEMAKAQAAHEVYIHAITDGRDVDPRSGLDYIKELEAETKKIGVGKIATVVGRYYAMDRDNRWNRVEAAYDAIVDGKGDIYDDAVGAVETGYSMGITDEFIKPSVIEKTKRIESSDVVIFFNFRSDRPRELCHALLDTKFSSFKPRTLLRNLHFVTMAEYDPKLPVTGVVFPSVNVADTLADEISASGLTQFHIAETEKYAHVTYFFNGGVEKPVTGEDRLLVPSPKVATYDLKPEMSLPTVEKELIARLGKYDFIVANFANPDMVGHTGVMPAAVEACRDIDKALAEVAAAARKAGYTVLVTADHGNIEKMKNPDGTPNTAHTTAQVPLILIGDGKYLENEVAEPKLANVAPTVLALLGLSKPKLMTSKSLFKEVG